MFQLSNMENYPKIIPFVVQGSKLGITKVVSLWKNGKADGHVTVKWQCCLSLKLPGNKLEGDVGDIHVVSLQARTSPIFR